MNKKNIHLIVIGWHIIFDGLFCQTQLIIAIILIFFNYFLNYFSKFLP
jgi:hypothetical protein